MLLNEYSAISRGLSITLRFANMVRASEVSFTRTVIGLLMLLIENPLLDSSLRLMVLCYTTTRAVKRAFR